MVPAACSPVIGNPTETGCSDTADNCRQQEAGYRETARNRKEKCDCSDLSTLNNTKRQLTKVLNIGSKQEMEEVALLQHARASQMGTLSSAMCTRPGWAGAGQQYCACIENGF